METASPEVLRIGPTVKARDRAGSLRCAVCYLAHREARTRYLVGAMLISERHEMRERETVVRLIHQWKSTLWTEAQDKNTELMLQRIVYSRQAAAIRSLSTILYRWQVKAIRALLVQRWKQSAMLDSMALALFKPVIAKVIHSLRSVARNTTTRALKQWIAHALLDWPERVSEAKFLLAACCRGNLHLGFKHIKNWKFRWKSNRDTRQRHETLEAAQALSTQLYRLVDAAALRRIRMFVRRWYKATGGEAVDDLLLIQGQSACKHLARHFSKRLLSFAFHRIVIHMLNRQHKRKVTCRYNSLS